MLGQCHSCKRRENHYVFNHGVKFTEHISQISLTGEKPQGGATVIAEQFQQFH